MSILHRLTKEEIREEFTHYGTFMGVPCYMADIDSDCPLAVEVNWLPECSLNIATAIWSVCAGIMSLFNDDYEPMFCFKITGEIEK